VDLIIRNARLFDRLSDGPLDIGVEQGRIIAIERGISSEADVYDAKGYLVCPGLIETHIHLDKSRIIDRCAPQERSQLSPVKGVTPLKKSMSVEDVRTRAERRLKSASSMEQPACARRSKSIPASACAVSRGCSR
jgi:cytosine deaminase